MGIAREDSGDNTPLSVDRGSYLKLAGIAAGLTSMLWVLGSGRTLMIASNGGRFSYQFSVNGNLGKSTMMGVSIDDNDIISGHTATGQGGGGELDYYTFSGEITDLSLNGDATVCLDETKVGAEEFLPNVLTVNGLGSYSNYEFATDGGIAPNYGITGLDTINVEDGRESGVVSSGNDSYAFSGDIGRFSLSLVIA